MMNDYYEVIQMKCVDCGQECVDIDMLCADCRRKRYDKHKCDRCGKKKPANLVGWYVPSYRGYIDIRSVCPDCIEFYHQEYIRKNKRLQEIPLEESKLDEEYKTLPHDNSPIDEDDGEYYVDGEMGLSLKEFQDEVRKYKKNRAEILRIREIRDNYWKRVTDLNKEKAECEAGSRFDLKANR